MRQVSTNLSTVGFYRCKDGETLLTEMSREAPNEGKVWPLFIKKVMRNHERESARENGWRADRCWRKVSVLKLVALECWVNSPHGHVTSAWKQRPRTGGYDSYSEAQKASWQERWNYCLLLGESTFLSPPSQGLRLAVWPHPPEPHAL